MERMTSEGLNGPRRPLFFLIIGDLFIVTRVTYQSKRAGSSKGRAPFDRDRDRKRDRKRDRDRDRKRDRDRSDQK
eukprot:95748-Prorocentrum_minimum.AAC.1